MREAVSSKAKFINHGRNFPPVGLRTWVTVISQEFYGVVRGRQEACGGLEGSTGTGNTRHAIQRFDAKSGPSKGQSDEVEQIMI